MSTNEQSTGTTKASNVTANYGLSQWAEGDRILREDFNHDNAAIDAALHTQAAQTAVAVKAVEEKISLVRLFQTTLTSAAASLSIDLSDIDLSQYIELELYITDMSSTATSGHAFYIYFSDGSDTGSVGGLHISSSYTYTFRVQMLDGGNMYSKFDECYYQKDGTVKETSARSMWMGHPLADVKTITLTDSSSKLTAGTSVTVYGRKK